MQQYILVLQICMRGTGSDSAVTEIVAEMTIVVLVITLAAVMGGMAFGLADILQPTAIVGVAAIRNSHDDITVMYYGGEKQAELHWMGISVNDTAPVTLGFVDQSAPLDVGNSTTVRAPVPGNDHIIVTGNFADGTEQVLLDTFA